MTTFESTALIGTCGWGYDDWNNVFYPDGVSGTDRLVHYADQFRTVEIDSTFYAIPARTTVRGWYRRSPDEFIFSAKFPRDITHQARLVGCGDLAATFVDVMSELGDRMGPLLIQLPPTMTARAFDDLARFLEGLPDGYSYAVEVRHRSWLTDQFAELLKRWNVAVVLTDGGHLDRFWRVTSRLVYIRWLGAWDAFERYDRLQRSVESDLDWWIPRMNHALDHGATVLGYVNNNFAGYAPDVADQVRDRLEPRAL